jgi:cellulose synthase/poly-beta-1,6-N-acetylglucosamine synthase-like glycosyltransferase
VSDVTVVIPVWGAYASLLPDCVRSVLAQRGPSVRVLVVDNASTEPLPSLPAEVDVMRLRERVGVGEARNAALGGIDSPLVCFFDADDVMLPGMLDALCRRVEADPGAVGAVGRFLTWKAVTGEQTATTRMPRPIVYRLAHHRRLFAASNLVFNSFLVAGGVYRTDAVRDAGGFGEGNLGEDWLLAIGLSLRGRLAFLPEALFLHRVEEGSLWHRRHEREEVEELYATARRRVAEDASAPAWARLALPATHLVHRLEILRRTRGGSLHPAPT